MPIWKKNMPVYDRHILLKKVYTLIYQVYDPL
jgi:hypothetical protein